MHLCALAGFGAQWMDRFFYWEGIVCLIWSRKCVHVCVFVNIFTIEKYKFSLAVSKVSAYIRLHFHVDRCGKRFHKHQDAA